MMTGPRTNNRTRAKPKSSAALHGLYQAYPRGRIGSRTGALVRFFGLRDRLGRRSLPLFFLSSSRQKGRMGGGTGNGSYLLASQVEYPRFMAPLGPFLLLPSFRPFKGPK